MIFFDILLNCFGGVSHNIQLYFKMGVKRKLFKHSDVKCIAVTKYLRNSDILNYANVDTRIGRSQMFVPTELPFSRSLLSYTILKRSLSERCFPTNNTVNMSIVLTLCLLYHSFRHHF